MIRTINVCRRCSDIMIYNLKNGLTCFKCTKIDHMFYDKITYQDQDIDKCKFQLEHLVLKQKGDS